MLIRFILSVIPILAMLAASSCSCKGYTDVPIHVCIENASSHKIKLLSEPQRTPSENDYAMDIMLESGASFTKKLPDGCFESFVRLPIYATFDNIFGFVYNRDNYSIEHSIGRLYDAWNSTFENGIMHCYYTFTDADYDRAVEWNATHGE